MKPNKSDKPGASHTDPIVLAIDTASRQAELAVSECDEILASFKSEGDLPHSQVIFSNIEAVLDLAGIRIGDVAAFAAATGPGSFTGVRVGLAAVKGLADSLRRPCLGVDSLDLFALSSGFDGLHLVIIDAGRTEVYCGRRSVAKEEVLSRSEEDLVGDPSVVLSLLMQNIKAEPFVVVGTEARKYETQVAEAIDNLLQNDQIDSQVDWRIGDYNAVSLAPTLARRAAGLLKANRISPVKPHYIRPSDAELKRKP